MLQNISGRLSNNSISAICKRINRVVIAQNAIIPRALYSSGISTSNTRQSSLAESLKEELKFERAENKKSSKDFSLFVDRLSKLNFTTLIPSSSSTEGGENLLKVERVLDGGERVCVTMSVVPNVDEGEDEAAEQMMQQQDEDEYFEGDELDAQPPVSYPVTIDITREVFFLFLLSSVFCLLSSV
jgi:hypothetical protein